MQGVRLSGGAFSKLTVGTVDFAFKEAWENHCMYLCIYVWMNLCLHVYVNIWKNLCMDVWTYVLYCTYVWLNLCMDVGCRMWGCQGELSADFPSALWMYAFKGAWENHCICQESYGQTEPLREVKCLDGLAGPHALGPSKQTRCEVVRVLRI